MGGWTWGGLIGVAGGRFASRRPLGVDWPRWAGGGLGPEVGLRRVSVADLGVPFWRPALWVDLGWVGRGGLEAGSPPGALLGRVGRGGLGVGWP